MVSLKAIQASNACVSTLPANLVAVFVGGTSGIGEYTLKEFARLARQPRIYNIGRSQEASDRIAAECKQFNTGVQYTFIQADVSLIRSVDAVCKQIQASENAVNILFLSAGTLSTGIKTEEGLNLNSCLKHHSRARFILNLLPLLESATSLRRVVSVLCGTKEGNVNLDDLQGWNAKGSDILKNRGHGAAIVTLINSYFAQQSPTVSFIHDYPGNVRSGIIRGTTGLLWAVLSVYNLLGSWIYIPNKESGERHLYYATSARFQAKDGTEEAIPLTEGVEPARGIDGVAGSGNYSTDQLNEHADSAVVELFEGFKNSGMMEQVWGLIESEFERIEKLP